MSFNCASCNSQAELASLAELSCSCLVCIPCASSSIKEQIQRAASTPDVPSPNPEPPPKAARRPAPIEVGDEVLYRTADGKYVKAIVEIVDISVIPPQYGIQLHGASDLRFTEGHRLSSARSGHGAPPPAPAAKKPQQLSVDCQCCGAVLALPYLRAIAPDAVAAWEERRTASWLQANDVIACPHPRCGALIQRIPAAAAAAAAGPAWPPRAPLSPMQNRRNQGVKQQQQQQQQQQPAPLSAAEAHREHHRYRCGACGRDFCDACRAAPYHAGLTCRQARAPDCLLCGAKVEETRLQALLPDAFGVSNEMKTAYRSKLRPRRGGGTAAAGGAGAASGGAAACGEGSAGGGGGADVNEAAVVARASRTELLVALKSRLGLDTSWCVEREDLEKALLHWGCRTCGSESCGSKRRDMCGRPLPCGHWCCGVRGEGEAHPRCVQCGADPATAAAAAAAAASASGSGSGSQAGAAGPASPARGGGGGAAMLTDCCFCWEPLSSAACIQMACGARHMCHLHCAQARLKAGYPGPNISFAYLYCPLCRGGDGASGAGAGPSGSSSSALQAALAPVHLEHPALAAELAPHLALREATVAAVRQRLRMDAELRADPALQPGGRFDGRPADFGLERLLFYKCSQCSKPYYGGQRACGAGGADAAPQPPADGAVGAGPAGADGAAAGPAAAGPAAAAGKELICGECCALAVGANCPRHGTAYIEWKCKYCCSLASWFCWGTTHFCDPCHTTVVAKRRLGPFLDKSSTCKDPKCALRGVKHPPPGQEACLGCGMCREGL